MALQFTGRDVALVRNDATGRFDLSFSSSGPNKGNPILDDTRTHAVLTTLLSWKRGTRPGAKTPEGGYLWDVAGRRGTLLWTVLQDRLATTSQLQAFAEDGGQQLLDLKQIGSFSARAFRIAPGRFRLDVAWSTPSGTPVTPLSLPLA